MEEGNDRTLELAAFRALDHGRRKSAPHHRLADRGRDEEGDGRPEAVPLLQQLVEHDDDHAGEEELGDDEDRVSGAKLLELRFRDVALSFFADQSADEINSRNLAVQH